MKNLLLFLSLFVSVCAFAQPSKINPTTMLKAGANNTVLQTDASGVVGWVAKNAAFTAGSGVTISAAGVIANNAPDLTVGLTGGGIAVVTGTYPTFVVTATEIDGAITNEGSLTVGAGTTTNSVISSNTTGSTAVTLAVGSGLSIAESGNTITLSAVAAAPTWTDEPFPTVTGSTITTAGTLPTTTNKIWVWREGSFMTPGAGKDITVSGNVITFANPLVAESVFVRYTN
jgi:hypothetical protein